MVKIDIMMPTYCYDCPLHNGENGRCNKTGASVFDKRPFDCPLREDKSTAEVEEVKHGEWELIPPPKVHEGGAYVKFRCSECGTEYESSGRYCSNCGARMDGKGNPIATRMDFPEDEVFLLSVDEYEKYKNRIPYVDCWWWLRSPGYHSSYAANVSSTGSVFYFGDLICSEKGAIRPALKISGFHSADLEIGSRFMKYDFPWIVITEGLAIAEVPIGFHRFDDETNDYQTSEIRRWIAEWCKRRDPEKENEDAKIH